MPYTTVRSTPAAGLLGCAAPTLERARAAAGMRPASPPNRSASAPSSTGVHTAQYEPPSETMSGRNCWRATSDPARRTASAQ